MEVDDIDEDVYKMREKIRGLPDTELEGLMQGSRTVAPLIHRLCREEFDKRCTDALFWALVEVDKQNRERYYKDMDQGPSLF